MQAGSGLVSILEHPKAAWPVPMLTGAGPIQVSVLIGDWPVL